MTKSKERKDHIKNRFHRWRKEAIDTLPTIRLTSLLKNPKLIPEKPGIYIMYNIDKYHPYVGESYNVRKRLIQHATVKYPTQYIDRDIKRLGPEKFRVGFIAETDRNVKSRRRVETHYVKLFNCYYNGYNGSKTGSPNSKFYRFCKKYYKKFYKGILPTRYKEKMFTNKHKGWFKMMLFSKHLWN